MALVFADFETIHPVLCSGIQTVLSLAYLAWIDHSVPNHYKSQ